ncbi:hypothetical protein [Gynurincola endophyticus]|jgi:hypothetical protein|uniref:hypothetical protein n=1 Tax=Gynurincola endophyticus TaxID=2479004 RepID=UPI000F8D046D|nr:hypothetical protein [Gynurincola endophyticus]
MKKYLSGIMLVLLTSVLSVACSKDDDPADNDLFVGTYKGRITYNTNDETKTNDNGSVTVVKTGNDYNFVFSDGIPDLTGVRFKKDGDNTVISVDEDEAKAIRITANRLNIAYAKDGAIWTADCTR